MCAQTCSAKAHEFAKEVDSFVCQGKVFYIRCPWCSKMISLCVVPVCFRSSIKVLGERKTISSSFRLAWVSVFSSWFGSSGDWSSHWVENLGVPSTLWILLKIGLCLLFSWYLHGSNHCFQRLSINLLLHYIESKFRDTQWLLYWARLQGSSGVFKSNTYLLCCGSPSA